MHVRRRLVGAIGAVALAALAITGLADLKDGTSNTLGAVPAIDGSSKEPAYVIQSPAFGGGQIASLVREPTIEPLIISMDRPVL